MIAHEIRSSTEASISLMIVAYGPPLLLLISLITPLQYEAIITLLHTRSAARARASLQAKASRTSGLEIPERRMAEAPKN
jgi:hypothetical protein